MIPWSVVLIAKNEAQTLPRLLGSLKEFQKRGGQVMLVDTGSADGTPEIARGLGCAVYEEGDRFRITIDEELAQNINARFGEKIVEPNQTLFDYSAARNYAASLSPTAMVCMPDCDEVFTTYNLEKIQEAIQLGVEQLEYNFVYCHDEFGNELVKFLHSKFYNRDKLQWTGVVHEVLTGEASRKWVGEDVIKLEHFQNPETNREGYLVGLAYDCYFNPTKDRQSHYFARELLYKGFYRAAIREFQYHTALDKWLPEKAQSQIFIGDCHLYLGEEEQAVEAWLKAFTMDSSRRESLMRLAEYYFKKNDYQKVAAYATAALTIPNGNFYANNQEHYTNKPHEYLYWALWYLGDFKGSAEHFQKAFSYQPLNSKYLHDLRFYEQLPMVSIILPTLGRPEGLQRCLQSIQRLNYPEEKIQTIVLEDTPRQGVPRRVAEGLSKAKGEVVAFASNDIEFHPDSLILAVLESKKKGLVAFNTGPVSEDEGNICEHFIIRQDLIEKIGGEIFDTEFYHIGVDNLLWHKAKKLNEATRCENAKITHFHWAKGSGDFDEVAKIAWSEENIRHDRELLAKKLQELNV